MWTTCHFKSNEWSFLSKLTIFQIMSIMALRWRNRWCYSHNTVSKIKGNLRVSPTPVSGALHDLRPFCHFKSRLIHGYHVKKHEKLHRISKKSTLSRQKKVKGVKSRIWDSFSMHKVWKSFIKIDLARNFILGLNDS